MAMTMNGEKLLRASRETVWTKLNDPEVLKACIPGCEMLEVIGENEFSAVATNKDRPGQGAIQRQGAAERARASAKL
jgi:uncharacterized protein